MRSLIAALLGVTVALPVGIATVPAHADNNGVLGQAQRFLNNNMGNQDHSDRYRRGDENDERYGSRDNDRYDRGSPDYRGAERRGEPEHQFGYNGRDRDYNNGYRPDRRYRGDNDQYYRDDRNDTR